MDPQVETMFHVQKDSTQTRLVAFTHSEKTPDAALQRFLGAPLKSFTLLKASFLDLNAEAGTSLEFYRMRNTFLIKLELNAVQQSKFLIRCESFQLFLEALDLLKPLIECSRFMDFDNSETESQESAK